MGRRESHSFVSQEYISDHRRFEEQPYKHHYTEIEVDIDEATVDFTYKSEKDEIHTRVNQHSYVYLEFEDTDKIVELFNFIREEPPDAGKSRKDFRIKGGYSKDVERDNRESIDLISVFRYEDKLLIETYAPANAVLFYWEESDYGDGFDTTNFEELQSFTRQVLGILGETDQPELQEIEPELLEQISKWDYGGEVRKHLQDGDACFRAELLHPSLNSYIHAMEWACIAYLKENGTDIIKEEMEGGRYYDFANGHHTLLEEVKSEVDLDQKTISKIEAMNKAERRWTAHHKSGDLLEPEVLSVRSRLMTLMEKLVADT